MALSLMESLLGSRARKSEDDISYVPNPSGRMVTVQEIANLSVVMVSSLARMVVGDVLFVTGGGAITTLDG